MNYANKRNIPYVVLVGEEELKNESFALKNMVSGEQINMSLNALIEALS
jgi:histidyl-tRNA synthetase